MFWNNVFLLAAVFVLTYDPKSRGIEKFIGQPINKNPNNQKPPVGRVCENAHYNAVQFGQEPYDCPVNNRVGMGAIYSNT